jgi:putative DNA primase/helicase
MAKRYGISYLDNAGNTDKIPIGELFKEDTVIYEGHNRHEGLLRVIESLIARNSNILTLDQIRDIAYQWNQKHCAPPLDDTQFDKQWHDATHFIAKKKSHGEILVFDDKKEDEKIDPSTIANEIVKHYKLRATRTDDHPIYRYNEDGKDAGIWTRAETWLAEIVKKHYPAITSRQFKEILFSIWTKEGVGVEPEEWDSNRWACHFNNGWFDLKTWTFEPHGPNSHERLSLVKSTVNYNPDIECKVINEALDKTLSKENRELYLKMIGYCFLPSYAFKKAFVLIGPKDSGKTTFKELIGHLVGWHNVSAVAWSDIDKPYMAAELEGKMVNLASEITKAQLLDSATFKKLTGDDTITSRKIRQAPTTFKNKAKMIIVVNDMPEFGEIDEAAIGRIIIIDFDRQFREDEIDKDLLSKMTTPEELSGLLNLALKGLKQVIEDNGFNEPDLEDKVAEYQERTSKLKDFIKDSCEIAPLKTVSSQELFKAYSQYCIRVNTRPLGDRDFGKELLNTYGNSVSKSRPVIDGKRVYVYHGIGLKATLPASA